MKMILCFLASLVLHTANAANNLTKTLVISQLDHSILVDLNAKTAQCLVGDYGSSHLKIVVPQLKKIARLDHTSRGAPGPCITAGACDSRNQIGLPTDSRLPILIDLKNPQETITVNVLMQEVYILNPLQKSCERIYQEIVTSKVRGIDFKHQASMPLASMSYDVCEKIISTGE